MTNAFDEKTNSGFCPHCDTYVQFVVVDAEGTPQSHARLLRCQKCGVHSFTLKVSGAERLALYPPRRALSIPYVPAAVMQAYTEAWVALEAGAPRAAACMLRRTVASACTEQGISDNVNGKFVPLNNRIQQLEGKLIPATLEAARNTKLLGDAGAHEEAEDELGPITAETVAAAMTVVRSFLANLYELPGQVKELSQTP